MAACAGKIAAMVAGILGRAVTEDQRCPCSGRMAHIAFARCVHVAHVFAGGSRAVVTSGASTGHACVIEIRRQPGKRRMTAVARLTGRDVVQWLAGRPDAIVAGCATASRHAGMIETCRCPRDRGVAVVAAVIASDVIGAFTCCDRPVVAREAGAGDLRMIDASRRSPDHGGVTGLAQGARRNMRGVLARCPCAIVTTCAVACDAVVAEARRHPATDRVAVFAGIVGENVAGILAGCLHTVVAAEAIPRHPTVIEACSSPKQCRVTGTAIQRGLNVLRRLSRRLHAVVTAAAGSLRLRMIEPTRGRPCHRRMTVLTTIGTEDMPCGLGHCSDTRTGRMATRAIERRRFEDTVDMAALAAHLNMGSRQLEARSEMVEVLRHSWRNRVL